MGGTPCLIIIRSLVKYDDVPSGHNQRAELESQLRQCYANPTIAAAVGEDYQKAEQVCEILDKKNLATADLQYLMSVLPYGYGGG
jgi:hypothetical protein